MKQTIIIGAGALAHEIAEWIGPQQIAGFLVDKKHAGSFKFCEKLKLHVLGTPEDAWRFEPDLYDFIIGVGDPIAKRALHARITNTFLSSHDLKRFRTFVHPLAYVARTATIGEGCVVGPFAVVGNNALLDDHSLMNYGAIMGHDSYAGRFSMLCPQASLMGEAELGFQGFMGAGATILPRRTLPARSTVGAGAVVTHSFVDDDCTYTGVPASVRISK